MSLLFFRASGQIIPKPVWAVGFAIEQTLRDATLPVFSFLIFKRLQHKLKSNLRFMKILVFVKTNCHSII
ncbi:MAG: hypothetical protein LBH59_01120 [Planctomycetaceae bacterium]|nr:hypothetical protein [Planctomycetaceae bacterium]